MGFAADKNAGLSTFFWHLLIRLKIKKVVCSRTRHSAMIALLLNAKRYDCSSYKLYFSFA